MILCNLILCWHVVVCPRSNERLDVGKAPVHMLKKAGIPLALGTDSLASNDSLQLLDEARFLLERFPGEFTPAEALRLATLSGAEAIGQEQEVGSIEPGKRADFLVVYLPENIDARELCDAIIGEGKVLEVFTAGSRLGVSGI